MNNNLLLFKGKVFDFLQLAPRLDFYSHPVVLQLLCYQTIPNQLLYENKTTGWLKQI